MSKLQTLITNHKATMRETGIIAFSNHPPFDSSLAFTTVDQAVAYLEALVTDREPMGLEELEEVVGHDVALFRGPRLLATIKHTPDGELRITRFDEAN